jgi:hypothetical protein
LRHKLSAIFSNLYDEALRARGDRWQPDLVTRKVTEMKLSFRSQEIGPRRERLPRAHFYHGLSSSRPRGMLIDQELKPDGSHI